MRILLDTHIVLWAIADTAKLSEKVKNFWCRNGMEIIMKKRRHEAECFIARIKQDKFDYTVWQREYFDQLAPGEFARKASAYAKSHPYTGKEQIL